jgi:HAD superfamily hydrolase (TIGR01509 family)
LAADPHHTLMIKAAIFDMDGLLIDSEPLWKQAERRIYETVDVFVDDGFLRQTEGLRLADSIRLVHSIRPFTSKTEAQLAEEITLAMCDLILERGEALPGVYETLEFFLNRRIPMALASSSASVLISAVVRKLSLERYFRTVRSGDREVFGKPHPQIFISTAQDLDVTPTECMVFEDSLNGVLAAKAARMFCVAVPDRHAYDDSRMAIADVKLRSLEDFNGKLMVGDSSLRSAIATRGG